MYLSSFYKFSSEKGFDMALVDLLRSIDSFKNIVRLIFFGSPANNHEFKNQRSSIASVLEREFKSAVPAYTYLAQPLLNDGTLGLEVQVIEDCEGALLEYSRHGIYSYVKMTYGEARMLFLSGIFYFDVLSSVHEQSDFIMKNILGILLHEGFSIADIVRQWNYIENITGRESFGNQRYQEFNDIRSHYYRTFFIDNGYPAATGIGTQYGGVQIEVDALSNSESYSHRIDNPSQRAAYEYSSKVLIGNKKKTTPKFERARSVSLMANGWIYISGTAAIRGELTIESDVVKQTELTLDNIRILLSNVTLFESGICGNAELKSLRVYVKRSADVTIVRECVESFYPSLEVIYVNADICRDNLLVEMEGYAFLDLNK